MNNYTLSPAAEQDLNFIWAYIAIDSPRADDRNGDAARFLGRENLKSATYYCEPTNPNPLFLTF
jgi:plasmid stabilization system protein ParE